MTAICKKGVIFFNEFLKRGEEEEKFSFRIVFSDEATSYLNGIVNRHNVQI